MLKYMFIFGAILDGLVAVSWFLIASGFQIPNILNGHTGTGTDFQIAMYAAAMFMAGWTVLLAWGALKPLERRDLLLITGGLLILSVIFEPILFKSLRGEFWFIFGETKRTVLAIIAIAIYFYSFKNSENQKNI